MLAMIGTKRLFARAWSSKQATYAVNLCSPCCEHSHNPKPIVSTLTIDLEGRLTVKVDEVRLLLRHLYGYNSACFLKPATRLRLPGRLNLVRISCCFKNTRHLTQTKRRSLDETKAPPLKVWMRGFILQSRHFTSKVKLLRSPFLGRFIIPFIQIKSKINKKSRSRILTD